MPRGRKKKQQEPVVEESKPLYDESVPPMPFSKGDRVLVYGEPDDGSEDFTGQVVNSKWSRQSGWWVDVVRDDNGLTYAVMSQFIDLLNNEEISEPIDEEVLV